MAKFQILPDGDQNILGDTFITQSPEILNLEGTQDKLRKLARRATDQFEKLL
jgi:hypothetical protein